jgi:hypothetical protein
MVPASSVCTNSERYFVTSVRGWESSSARRKAHGTPAWTWRIKRNILADALEEKAHGREEEFAYGEKLRLDVCGCGLQFVAWLFEEEIGKLAWKIGISSLVFRMRSTLNGVQNGR